MNYGEIKTNDIANGEGVRTSLFVSGCTHHCKNCFNAKTWDFLFGSEFTRKTEDEIIESLRPGWISGLTVLGGEPFEPENQKALLPFMKRVKRDVPEKSVWFYSGYLFEELCGKKESRAFCAETSELLSTIDVLVDGEFVQELYDISLAFRGSSNQRVIDVKKSLAAGKVILYLE